MRFHPDIADNSKRLQHVAGLLCALTDLVERAGGRSHAICCLVLWLIAPAEAVARGYVDGIAPSAALPQAPQPHRGHQLMAMAHARDRMNDCRAISLQRKPWMKFTPEAAYRLHEETRTFIDSALKAGGRGLIQPTRTSADP